MEKNIILDENLNEYQDERMEVELISTSKFIILSLATFGLYNIWWTYKVWRFFKWHNMPTINPALRAFLSIVYLYSLFETIKKFAKKNGYDKDYLSGTLFITIIFLNLLGRLESNLGLLSLFSFFPYIPALKAFNWGVINSSLYNGKEASGFNFRQIILLIIGVILYLLLFAGLTKVE